MPLCDVVYFRKGNAVPLLEWLASLPPQARNKCLTYLSRLEAEGHELRRPIADLLRDGIYELRPSYQGVHHRILYFFRGRNVAVVSHGLTKEGTVPAAEIERAIRCKRWFEADPAAHSFRRSE